MGEFKISGLNKVKTVKSNFKKEFGGGLKIYNGVQFAKDDDTIGSIAKKTISKGSEISANGNLQAGSFEKQILEAYGIRVNVTDSLGTNVPNNTRLSRINDSPIDGTYTVGDETVVIKTSGNKLTGSYFKNAKDAKKGELSGKIEGKTFEGKFTDANGNKGLMKLVFNNKGFEGKWGAGDDIDKLRGKWNGAKK